MSLAEIESLVSTLTPAELAQLESILGKERRHRESAKTRFLNFDDFSGSVVLSEDPVEWQRRARADWT